MTRVEAETLRRKHRPSDIRVLFVAESPPAGGTFFYAANSNLFRAMASAFAEVFGRQVPSGEGFLEFFQLAGCYLDDLCLEPVNRMSASDRGGARKAGEKSLASRLVAHKPAAVVAVPMLIRPDVERALALAGLVGIPVYSLPFPAMGHQQRFATELGPLLKELGAQNVLRIQPA